MVFDPSNGRTYSLPADAFEVVTLIREMVPPGYADRSQLIDRVLEELDPGSGDSPSPSSALARENVARWVDLAIRLSR